MTHSYKSLKLVEFELKIRLIFIDLKILVVKLFILLAAEQMENEKLPAC
jgi:hypothetical protein